MQEIAEAIALLAVAVFVAGWWISNAIEDAGEEIANAIEDDDE